MMETADSVRQYGVLVPAIARPDPEGGYEVVAGHRRHRASELAEKATMPVIVRDLDDDAATLIMVDSNLQRESLLPSERAFAYKMKLEMCIRDRYRPDALVWSDTLGLWQTHAALDIAAPLGTAVSACADGTVTEAYRDPLLGYTVRVEHADGYESLYACLQSAEMVEVGRTVQMGDVIGAVGESADAEADLGAHLHFAFFLDGEAMQPPLEGA